MIFFWTSKGKRLYLLLSAVERHRSTLDVKTHGLEADCG